MTLRGHPAADHEREPRAPITVEIGTNILVGRDTARLEKEVERILHCHAKVGASDNPQNYLTLCRA